MQGSMYEKLKMLHKESGECSLFLNAMSEATVMF